MTVRRGSVLASAALGAALTPLNSTMVAVALPALSAEFDAPASTVTLLVVTGYLVATIVAQLPAGSVADRVGYTRALTWGRLMFGGGAAVGMLAQSLAAVVVGRLLMAAGGALIIPTAMALLRISYPVERRARAFGVMGGVMGGAAAIGPALGAAPHQPSPRRREGPLRASAAQRLARVVRHRGHDQPLDALRGLLHALRLAIARGRAHDDAPAGRQTQLLSAPPDGRHQEAVQRHPSAPRARA